MQTADEIAVHRFALQGMSKPENRVICRTLPDQNLMQVVPTKYVDFLSGQRVGSECNRTTHQVVAPAAGRS